MGGKDGVKDSAEVEEEEKDEGPDSEAVGDFKWTIFVVVNSREEGTVPEVRGNVQGETGETLFEEGAGDAVKGVEFNAREHCGKIGWWSVSREGEGSRLGDQALWGQSC